MGVCPFGFTAEDGKLVPHAGEQLVVARVHALRNAGASLREIVTSLEIEGAVSRAGKSLKLTQVARIVRASHVKLEYGQA